jgi:hypothetical protein
MMMPTETARSGDVGPEAGAAPARHRSLPDRRRGLYWVGVLVALAALVGGGIIVFTAWSNESAPESAAVSYFRALARGDAPAALGMGDVPDGVHSYLTSDVLQLSLKVAKIDNVHVLSVDRKGGTARVTVQYQLVSAGSSKLVNDAVETVKRGRTWRLTKTAVPVQVRVEEGQSRLSIGGTPLPSRTVLFFPGALPISVDTSNLELDPVVVHLSSGAPPPLLPKVSATGKLTVARAVAAAVTQCLKAHADMTCPTADDLITVVPGSVRGTVDVADVAAHLNVTLAPNPDGAAGRLQITGSVDVKGSFQVLDFDNQPVRKTGTVRLGINATCYATNPAKIVWMPPL